MATLKIAWTVLFAGAALGQSWTPANSGTSASLRGISAVNAKTVWASGTGGTYLKTINGGATWQVHVVPGAEGLDFRDVQGINARMAYLMSAGTGEKSRIYKTTDGGSHWTLQFTNPDPKGFFDALAFWDAKRGIVLGDPVDGQFTILTTDDGGEHWTRQPTPPALANEGAFAASGTCLIAMGRREAWFGTGGPAAARVFHSTDAGGTWNVATTPIRNDGASAGIFSLAFSDSQHGVATGGDYAKPAETSHNIAITTDGGRTWTEPQGTPPSGFRSAVAFVRNGHMWIATGTSGSDVSYDRGQNWKRFDDSAFNALSFVSSKAGWAAGPKGALSRFRQPVVAPYKEPTAPKPLPTRTRMLPLRRTP